MSDAPVIVIGAGGHAKVVIELIREGGEYEVVGVIDADPATREVLGVAVIGDDSALERLRREGLDRAFVALGDNRRRLEIGRRVEAAGFSLVNAVSLRAAISPSARVGAGVAIMAGAVVNADSWIEDFAVLNTNASIDHDCVLGEACHVGPGSALAGRVNVGRLAFLGVGTRAIPGVSIGEGSIIGAAACVTRDIPAGVLAHGVPAKIIRTLDGAGR